MRCRRTYVLNKLIVSALTPYSFFKKGEIWTYFLKLQWQYKYRTSINIPWFAWLNREKNMFGMHIFITLQVNEISYANLIQVFIFGCNRKRISMPLFRWNHSGYGLPKIIKRIKRGSKKFIAIHIDYDVITALCFTKTSICMGYASKILDIKSI